MGCDYSRICDRAAFDRDPVSTTCDRLQTSFLTGLRSSRRWRCVPCSTRPDFRFTDSFDLAPLRRVFVEGTDDGMDGTHLGIGTITASDVFQITSFASFQADVGMPLRTGLQTPGDFGALIYSLGLSNGWQMGGLEWERRLRPPMMQMYIGPWLGKLTRIAEVTLAKAPGWIENNRQKEWPMLLTDLTKGVREVAPVEAPVDLERWCAYTAAAVPKYNKARAEAGSGTRRAYRTTNLTNWVSAAGDGTARRPERGNEMRCERSFAPNNPRYERVACRVPGPAGWDGII